MTKLPDDAEGKTVISGSHGGVYATYLACKAGAKAVILNDAGIGKGKAGIGGGPYADELGIPYAAVDTMSARIGDVQDQFDRGRISYVNERAATVGVAAGMSVVEAIDLLAKAPEVTASVPAYEESRQVRQHPATGLNLVLIDSASLVSGEDDGQFVVTGSHGGLPSPDPLSALRADARVACFNDAGGGADGAGYTRLPALQDREIAGITVAAASARIGDAVSTYEDGYISQLNETAIALGGALDMPLKEFFDHIRL